MGGRVKSPPPHTHTILSAPRGSSDVSTSKYKSMNNAKSNYLNSFCSFCLEIFTRENNFLVI